MGFIICKCMENKEHFNFKDRTREKYITNEGYTVEIIECINARNYTIRFDSGVILKNREYKHIKNGNIKNPYHKSVLGVGYVGVGEYSKTTHYKIYTTWINMLKRCYSEKYQKNKPTYIGCTAEEEWYNFQNFAKWFEENYKIGFELDKDILIKENKTYSPETCCFVPREINMLFVKRNKLRGKYPVGVFKKGNRFIASLCINGRGSHLDYFDTPEEAFQLYKIAKEAHIKNMTDKWKLLIKPNVYQALYNYKVAITD